LNPGILLAFDFGTRRIGLAVGQTLVASARPLENVDCRHGRPDWPRIDSLLTEWDPQALVVGLPLNMDGSDNDTTGLARKFGRQLSSRYNRPVHLIDERLSSRTARAALEAEGTRSDRIRERIDGASAQIILQTFFRENPGGP
jgi:putative Holliday junction resolvase